MGLAPEEFWEQTPREFEALKNARTDFVRHDLQGIANAFASYFEAHRVDKNGNKLPGKPITADNFLPPDPHPQQGVEDGPLWKRNLAHLKAKQAEIDGYKSMMPEHLRKKDQRGKP